MICSARTVASPLDASAQSSPAGLSTNTYELRSRLRVRLPARIDSIRAFADARCRRPRHPPRPRRLVDLHHRRADLLGHRRPDTTFIYTKLAVEDAIFALEWAKGLGGLAGLKARSDANAAALDRIVSVGMFEHVGHKNYERYFTTMNRLLKPAATSVRTPAGIILISSVLVAHATTPPGGVLPPAPGSPGRAGSGP